MRFINCFYLFKALVTVIQDKLNIRLEGMFDADNVYHGGIAPFRKVNLRCPTFSVFAQGVGRSAQSVDSWPTVIQTEVEIRQQRAIQTNQADLIPVIG
ncbi:hypothetical protein GCM10010965_21430 [Caldalkalibacillus thermarum]|uniref:hypothetical protein n=1 Tax=Caldalkalibacillus thermarum TaxID=296745 RepID=UPI001664B92C|nr:hypothetical protein [Caldalkalibacillus thermarum]GGK28262.1 hypothetical protein GCM10010965_21430 [Caldalkalibacillus thermarum]